MDKADKITRDLEELHAMADEAEAREKEQHNNPNFTDMFEFSKESRFIKGMIDGVHAAADDDVGHQIYADGGSLLSTVQFLLHACGMNKRYHTEVNLNVSKAKGKDVVMTISATLRPKDTTRKRVFDRERAAGRDIPQ